MTNLKNIAVAIASVVIFSNITQAQVSKAAYSVSYAEPFKVKYLGEAGEYLRFEITMGAENHPKAKFSIVEASEGELYSSLFDTNFKVRTVKIEKRGYQELNFKLAMGSATYSKTFSVNTKQVETTTVAESDITMF